MTENTSSIPSKNSFKRREYYEKNKEEIYRKHRIYIQNHSEARKEYLRAYWQDPLNRERRKSKYKENVLHERALDKAHYHKTRDRHRELHISRKYGISVEEYRILLAKNLCEICGRPQNVKNKVLCIDHNHITGKIRGMLCGNCNNAIGHVREDISLLDKIKEYLIKHA